MKIYIIIAWFNELTQTNPAIVTRKSKKDAIQAAKFYEELYQDCKYRKILIRCDDGNYSKFIEY